MFVQRSLRTYHSKEWSGSWSTWWGRQDPLNVMGQPTNDHHSAPYFPMPVDCDMWNGSKTWYQYCQSCRCFLGFVNHSIRWNCYVNVLQNKTVNKLISYEHCSQSTKSSDSKLQDRTILLQSKCFDLTLAKFHFFCGQSFAFIRLSFLHPTTPSFHSCCVGFFDIEFPLRLNNVIVGHHFRIACHSWSYWQSCCLLVVLLKQ